MPHQPVIDGFEFASAGATQRGTWPLRELPRLRDMLAQDAGEVAYEIAGVRDARGRPGLRLKVSGTLVLRCQRCLEPMEFEVDTDETLVLAATLAEIHAEPADAHAPDRVVAGKEMALARADRGRADPGAAVRAAARGLQRAARRGTTAPRAIRRSPRCAG